MKRGILFCLFIFLFGCSGEIDTIKSISYDPFLPLDTSYVLTVSGENITTYTTQLKSELAEIENWFALGDNYLLLARLDGTPTYWNACDSYDQYPARDHEEQAIVYETMASLNCSGEYEVYLEKAVDEWKKVGVEWRVTLLGNLLNDSFAPSFNTTILEPDLDLSSFDAIIIGNTTITVDSKTKVLSQSERVFRDWLGLQLTQDPFSGEILTVFSERLSWNESELQQEIGWHEGGRMKDLEQHLGITPLVAVGTLASELHGKWYAINHEGLFSYEIPYDKITYPTTRFLHPRLALIVDTHGVNMLVEQSIRKEVDVVLSDCDYWDKTKAAKDLSDHGIKVVCFPDRFVFHALGHDINLVGSPVWKVVDEKMIYGNSPIEIQRGEAIVVSDASFGEVYALQYYNAPQKYFSVINETFPLEIIKIEVEDFGELYKIFDTAKEKEVSFVATRIFSSDDYTHAKHWLAQDEDNTLLLFHSTMYPWGINIMQEFPNQVSFNDPNPIGIIKGPKLGDQKGNVFHSWS